MTNTTYNNRFGYQTCISLMKNCAPMILVLLLQFARDSIRYFLHLITVLLMSLQVRMYDPRLSRRPVVNVEIGSSPLVSMVLGANDRLFSCRICYLLFQGSDIRRFSWEGNIFFIRKVRFERQLQWSDRQCSVPRRLQTS